MNLNRRRVVIMGRSRGGSSSPELSDELDSEDQSPYMLCIEARDDTEGKGLYGSGSPGDLEVVEFTGVLGAGAGPTRLLTLHTLHPIFACML